MNEVPPENIKTLIEKTCQFLQDNGLEHEEFLKSTKTNDKNFSFLFPSGDFHQYYRSILYGSGAGAQLTTQADSQNSKSTQGGNSSKGSQALSSPYSNSGSSHGGQNYASGSQNLSSQAAYPSGNAKQSPSTQGSGSNAQSQASIQSQSYLPAGGGGGGGGGVSNQYSYQHSPKSSGMHSGSQQFQQSSYQASMGPQYVQTNQGQYQAQYNTQQQYQQNSQTQYQGPYQQGGGQAYLQQSSPSQYQQYQLQGGSHQYQQGGGQQYQGGMPQYQSMNPQAYQQGGQPYSQYPQALNYSTPPAQQYQPIQTYNQAQQYQQNSAGYQPGQSQYMGGQQNQQSQQQYTNSQGQYLSGGQAHFQGNSSAPQPSNYILPPSGFNSSNAQGNAGQMSSQAQNSGSQAETKKKNRWGVVTTASASESQAISSGMQNIQGLDVLKKGVTVGGSGLISNSGTPGLNIASPFMHLNSQLNMLLQSNNLTGIPGKAPINKAAVGGGGVSTGIPTPIGRESDLEQKGVPLQFDSPEDIPIGVVVEMIKQQQKKFADKYTPLEPANAPQRILSYSEVQPEGIKSKLDSFQKFLSEERESERRFKRKLEREREKELASSNDKKSSRDKFSSKKRDSGSGFTYNDYISDEMSMRSDGQAIGGFSQGEERKGLGSSSEDIFSKFRKQRSYHYHVSAEERSLNRDQPQLCYVCQMPGHIARDCKFGLT